MSTMHRSDSSKNGEETERDEKRNDDSDDGMMLSLLQNVVQKVEASLLVKVQNHTKSQGYSHKKDGLDFLDTKNSILLSYMIDLVYHLRSHLMTRSEAKDGSESNDVPSNAPRADVHSYANYQRLMEMKTIMDKSSGLDRKLRYQIDKILLHASSHISATAGTKEDDPLQFRPTIAANEDDEDTSQSNSDDDENEEDVGIDHSDDDDDDDIVSARQTLLLSRQKNQSTGKTVNKKKNTTEGDDDDGKNDSSGRGIYRAPRLVAAPYNYDASTTENETAGNGNISNSMMDRKEQRLRQKLRASEMVQTLKNQVDPDRPDQEDTTGGGIGTTTSAIAGYSNEQSRRFVQQQKERTKYEEDYMIRFTTTKKEKKEHQRLLRQEQSNLSSLSDIRNLVRDTSTLMHKNKKRKQHSYSSNDTASMYDQQQGGRSGGGDRDDSSSKRKGHAGIPKNSLQAELFGGGKSNSRTTKKNKR
jgi:U3 small nucleolar ribonucleoprotein protein LCP5